MAKEETLRGVVSNLKYIEQDGRGLAVQRATRHLERPLRWVKTRENEDWLGRRDSNPNNRVQSAVSYR